MKGFTTTALTLALVFAASSAPAARAKITPRAADPYVGAVVMRADDGKVLFAANADAACYPASIVKLMMLLIVQEKIEQGALRLSDKIAITAQAAKTGGSQVYLKEHEEFAVEDLLYALIIQSANDAAVALAVQIAGSADAFAQMMQEKAKELGMTRTEFHSVHGLPPAASQQPDVSTANDLAILARELLKHPDTLRYTSTTVRPFRDGSFEMRSHNSLLSTCPGCDGLKTGYFSAGGYSIAATAVRKGVRLIAVVAGSKSKQKRDAKAQELLSQAFSSLPSAPDAAAMVKAPAEEKQPPGAEMERAREETASTGGSWLSVALKIVLRIILYAAGAAVFFWLGRISRP
ncbi:MAG: D-alanyl-D-alanine carboxypeptidase [Candidatus Aureabacteria bacterium]|nr:D-alanyl-D-alanine carboxypeptidase [Candidatus Auribacterota bacterium]